MIERGRWTRPKIPHTHGLCKTCDTLEDEMHVFLECDRYTNLQQKYLPSYLYKNPSMFKFVEHLQKADGQMLSNLAVLCFKIFRLYDENEL